ncbi:2-succinyl-5-enolpyruvyl-6-hydroxy-3-cyclohexene-1-carboxylic-acid synthase [Vibrio sp. SM6]|uniref:2-succinyl-5-enolpyruvyl-6-hydroxy-3-cyclohexene-1-carboxylate synthase n=1 Tax=Vibrio agarilyticus TaxID=2726741 RepID=A0A7X8YHT9_9VIBR|nr:2-succinyl-5-enolpyruvyl-6-hydroxy-3-cyclohexene-1-carboxylic-acid synthase [Vibrio agarilyticus]
MTHDQAVLNRLWSEIILEELARLGVNDVCIAPGSRSTPLTLEAIAHKGFTLHKHFDERGLGFLALGLAKATACPVVVIVTSGTAVANLLPAAAEASLTGERLIFLTADRPAELVGCGANQAINQLGLFASQQCPSLNLPSPSIATPLPWLLSAVDELIDTQAKQGGPVQINCPFPEPLYSQGDKAFYHHYLTSIDRWQEGQAPWTRRERSAQVGLDEADIEQLSQRRGVIVVGSVSLTQAMAAKQLAHTLGWPLLADPQSGITSAWAHYDIWLSQPSAQAILHSCDLVLQFGARLVSKRLLQWLERHLSQQGDYWLVHARAQRINPSHLSQRHWPMSANQFVEQALLNIGDNEIVPAHFGWGEALKPYSSLVTQAVATLNGDAETDDLTEVALALDMAQRTQECDLMLGNSLIVRLADMFASIDNCEVFSNRGASGIDGLIATAAGVARGRQRPLLIYLGDTSALYDLNSLALLSQQITPVVLVVSNNDGGAIFDFLPVPAAQKQDWYQMPHGYDFAHAAAQFRLSYAKPDSLVEFQACVARHLNGGHGALLVEVQTPPEQASQQVKAVMAACIGSA